MTNKITIFVVYRVHLYEFYFFFIINLQSKANIHFFHFIGELTFRSVKWYVKCHNCSLIRQHSIFGLIPITLKLYLTETSAYFSTFVSLLLLLLFYLYKITQSTVIWKHHCTNHNVISQSRTLSQCWL